MVMKMTTNLWANGYDHIWNDSPFEKMTKKSRNSLKEIYPLSFLSTILNMLVTKVESVWRPRESANSDLVSSQEM